MCFGTKNDTAMGLISFFFSRLDENWKVPRKFAPRLRRPVRLITNLSLWRFHEFHVELKRGASWNQPTARARGAVPQVRWDD